jgi:plastocyanin
VEHSGPLSKSLGLGVALLAAWLGSKLLAAAPPAATREIPKSTGPISVESTAGGSGGGAAASSGKKGAKYEVVSVTDGGAIRVSLKLTKAPEGPEVTLNKDQKGCGHETMASGRADCDGATLGLANGVVWLVDITKGKAFDGDMAEAERIVTLDQKGCAYHPHVMLARAGAKVSIKNSDGVQHNAKGFLNSKATLKFNVMSSSNSVLPPSDDTVLDKPGLVILNCDIHLWMTGYIQAVPHPYYAVTGPDGTATLTNVPPGTYKVACWHEGMVLKMESTGANITGYRYSDDFTLPAQTVTVPPNGSVDVAFTTDPR